MTTYLKQLKIVGGLGRTATKPDPMPPSGAENVLLVGDDRREIIQKRFQRSGAIVTRAGSRSEALDVARHQSFKRAVLLANDSLLSATEIACNLHDLYGSMQIFIVIDARFKKSHRALRQLYEHPIAGTEIVTRRQLQKRLHGGGSDVNPSNRVT